MVLRRKRSQRQANSWSDQTHLLYRPPHRYRIALAEQRPMQPLQIGVDSLRVRTPTGSRSVTETPHAERSDVAGHGNHAVAAGQHELPRGCVVAAQQRELRTAPVSEHANAL